MLSVARKPKDDTGLGNVEGGKSRVGPYRLCVELATGGMSVVYLARKEGTQGVVALKVLSPELTKDPTYLDMFVDETNIASRIRHPNVCTVFDFDRTEGDCYIAMEYIIGEPATAMRGKLARRQGDAASNARHIARFLSDVCEGLHAAHELCDEDGEPMNVVHRDISPENLFLTYDGVAKIVDFGLVNSTTQHHRTRTGLLKGKFAYIAPEMLNGQRPDRRADIWGLGLVAWELLTGKRLFRRNTDVETLRAVVDAVIPPPSELRPGIPKELDDIVIKALARNPDDRFPTALDLGRELLRVSASGDEVISNGDLARWMDELFPAGAERRRNLIELAVQLKASESEAPPPRLERNSPSAFPAAITGELSTMATIALDRSSALSSCPTPRPAVSDVTPAPERRPLSRAALVAAIGVGAILGSATTTGLSSLAHSPRAEAATALPPAAILPADTSLAATSPAATSLATSPAATSLAATSLAATSPAVSPAGTSPQGASPSTSSVSAEVRTVPGSFVVSGPVVIEITGDPAAPVLSIRPRP